MQSVTPFSVLEADKENIKHIPQGRSAAKLSELVTTDHESTKKRLMDERKSFEDKLLPQTLQDLDDPLELYINYISWIRENYISGNSKESQIIQVLEQATYAFRDTPHYKNDVRYFKLWLEYITYSDNPGDVYHYLFKKQIGNELTLFYEHYSQYLEAVSQWDKADELFKLGISNSARPLQRLTKSYLLFNQRKELNNQSMQKQSRAGTGLVNPSGEGLSSITSVVNTRENSMKRKHSKIEIFTDAPSSNTASEPHFTLLPSDSVKFPDSIANSKKENVIQPLKSWSGEIVKSSGVPTSAPKKSRLQIFDDKSIQYPITKTVLHANGITKNTYDYNLDLFIPNESAEKANSMSEVLLMFFKPLPSTLSSTSKSQASNLYHTPSHKRTKSDASNQQDTPLVEYFKSSKKLFQNNDNQQNQPPLDMDKLMDDLMLNNNDPEVLNSIGGGFSDLFQDTITKTLEKVSTPIHVENTITSKARTKSNDDLMSSPFVENPNLIKYLPEIVNPYDAKTMAFLNESIYSSLYNSANYSNLSSIVFGKLPILQSILKQNSPPIYGNKQTLVEFGDDNLFCFTKELSRNSHSFTYLCEKMDGQTNSAVVSSPSNTWEAFIIKKINEKTKDFISATSFFHYLDESYLLLPYFKQDTVLNMVNTLNNHQSLTNKNLLEETSVIYFTIQLLNNMIKLHSLGFIHCNINPSSCMMSIDIPNNKLTFNDIQFSDFSKSIDCSLFSAATKFQTTSNEIPWKFEHDYIGVANVIHTLLFGFELKTVDTSEGVFLTESVKKYWQRDLWNELFKILLNADSSSGSEISVEKVKSKFESWFSLTVDKRLFIGKLKNVVEILESKK